VIHLPQKPGIYGIEVLIVKPLEPADRVEIVLPKEVPTTTQPSPSEGSKT
jgi:ribosomal protein S3